MKVLRILHCLIKNRHYHRIKLAISTPSRILDHFYPRHILKGSNLNYEINCRQLYTQKAEDDIEEEYPLLENEPLNQEVKYILFKNSGDYIINELNDCTSIERICSVLKKYKGSLRPEHITQTVLVLNDLQSIYCEVNSAENPSNVFLSNLYERSEFLDLLNSTSEYLNNFDSCLLSYLLLYLHKLGISVDNELVQRMYVKLRDQLLEDFSLDRCAKLLKVIFAENSVRPYYVSLSLIPKICNSIDGIEHVEDLENLTLCLNKLHNIVTEEILEKYKDKIQLFIKSRKLKSSDHSAILRIILFLNYPEWRHTNTVLVADCISLLKNEINLLGVSELLILYEVFFKIQEPGHILNEIQRCAAKFWQNSDETNSYDIVTNLKLFTTLLYFSSPLHRMQFQEDISKFLKKSDGLVPLVMLRKVFSYIKVSDKNLCEQYWNKSLGYLEKTHDIQNTVKLCENYMHFNTDVDNFRHRNFERKIFQLLWRFVEGDDIVYPSDLTVCFCFTLVYGRDKPLLDLFMDKLEENITQLKPLDCLKISQSIGLSMEVDNGVLSREHIRKIKELLHRQTANILAIGDCNFHENSVLIKAAVLRHDYTNFMIDNLFEKFKEMDFMSSKMLEIFTNLLTSTDNLVPEIVNKCTEYIINHRSNIIGFNAEKILFMCYHLAYYPINADKFFHVVTDIIIRDQERLSGLAFLQSALSLCFFNKLPSFLVKQIFNVEFMDRLDNELANCYSKDKYPQKVRKTLMQLNRAVCLEYPEFNVPWFHKKYEQEMERKYKQERDYNLPVRIKEYLYEMAGSSKSILENIVTPYGYHIDFVVNLDKEDKIISADSDGITKRMALLLIHQHAFTRFYTHLKGKYQMKKKHLEMLGYGVSILNANEWSNLLYSSERVDYLTDLIWPGRSETGGIGKRGDDKLVMEFLDSFSQQRNTSKEVL
ncbi:hypothetical protein JTB14_012146 [Gonioctena quinquepunctata]|nr:hypothetical protein JTB14_012146 [Gonioctena quinquepunctata]